LEHCQGVGPGRTFKGLLRGGGELKVFPEISQQKVGAPDRRKKKICGRSFDKGHLTRLEEQNLAFSRGNEIVKNERLTGRGKNLSTRQHRVSEQIRLKRVLDRRNLGVGIGGETRIAITIEG